MVVPALQGEQDKGVPLDLLENLENQEPLEYLARQEKTEDLVLPGLREPVECKELLVSVDRRDQRELQAVQENKEHRETKARREIMAHKVHEVCLVLLEHLEGQEKEVNLVYRVPQDLRDLLDPREDRVNLDDLDPKALLENRVQMGNLVNKVNEAHQDHAVQRDTTGLQDKLGNLVWLELMEHQVTKDPTVTLVHQAPQEDWVCLVCPALLEWQDLKEKRVKVVLWDLPVEMEKTENLVLMDDLELLVNQGSKDQRVIQEDPAHPADLVNVVTMDLVETLDLLVSQEHLVPRVHQDLLGQPVPEETTERKVARENKEIAARRENKEELVWLVIEVTREVVEDQVVWDQEELQDQQAEQDHKDHRDLLVRLAIPDVLGYLESRVLPALRVLLVYLVRLV